MIPSGHTAVMASRREPPNSLDFFPTPPWATRAMMGHVLPELGMHHEHLGAAWDPACGEGHMSEVLAEYVGPVQATDIFDYGKGYGVADFLDPATRAAPGVEMICTNPPFNAAMDFLHRGLALAPIVILLLRTGWVHVEERYVGVFLSRPPTLIAFSVERIPMHRGRWLPNGSSATDYAWFVWVDGKPPQPPMWIPPGRKRALTRPDDARRFGVMADAPLFEAMDLA